MESALKHRMVFQQLAETGCPAGYANVNGAIGLCKDHVNTYHVPSLVVKNGEGMQGPSPCTPVILEAQNTQSEIHHLGTKGEVKNLPGER